MTCRNWMCWVLIGQSYLNAWVLILAIILLFDRTTVRSNIPTRSVKQVSIRNSWCWRLYISETMTTTETSFIPVGSVTLGLGHSENRTRISLTVSEIFDRKHKPWTRYFFILIFLSFWWTGQHSVYFDHVTPPREECQSWIVWYQMKDILGEKRIFDFGGKIVTRWFTMMETNSLF